MNDSINNNAEVIEKPKKTITCPKCGSTEYFIDKKGFSANKGCCGLIMCGPIGLLFGQSGANKLRKTCLNCNKNF